MKLRHAFRDMQPGDVCTATIRYFRLPIKLLTKRKGIRVDSRGNPRRHDEYIFLGLERALEQELPANVDYLS